jgi:hypothetical protein
LPATNSCNLEPDPGGERLRVELHAQHRASLPEGQFPETAEETVDLFSLLGEVSPSSDPEALRAFILSDEPSTHYGARRSKA